MLRFNSKWYQNFNKVRLEHLDSLGLNLEGKKVLEVGAGVGDLTQFWLDRNCGITATEPKNENLAIIKNKFPLINTFPLDLNQIESDLFPNEKFDIIFCYGVLYHLENPAKVIQYLSKKSNSLLLLETVVSNENGIDIDKGKLSGEVKNDEKLGLGGHWNRITRELIFMTLKFFFPYVYIPITQPRHEHFPIDWNSPIPNHVNPKVKRAIFVASCDKLDAPLLSNVLLQRHTPFNF